MEPENQTPPRSHSDPEIAVPDCESPPRPPAPEENDGNQNIPPRDSGNEPMKKIGTPDRLRVPKAFKFPERYRSPTDAMMSPVTKGILARNRKSAGGSLLPPSLNQTKIHELHVAETSLSNEA